MPGVAPQPPPYAQAGYPLTFHVDYPEGGLNRLTTAFRLVMVIPIAILFGTIGDQWSSSWNSNSVNIALTVTAGLLFLPVLLMLVFRHKYPRWWFDWNLNLLRFENRVNAYVLLLRDEYPSTDEEQAVHLELPYPDAPRELNRWLPIVKWLLAIPHYIILWLLSIAAVIVVILAWFAILFTGRYPRGMFDFVVGVMRWGNRVIAYAVVLATDKYPPFSLN
jgi:hypothetical protein